jgi:hypothetical protein
MTLKEMLRHNSKGIFTVFVRATHLYSVLQPLVAIKGKLPRPSPCVPVRRPSQPGWYCAAQHNTLAPATRQNLCFPPTAAPSAPPTRIRLAIASSSAWPPDGDGWLHEIKHDGRGRLKLINRGGHDRTPLFGFRGSLPAPIAQHVTPPTQASMHQPFSTTHVPWRARLLIQTE